MCGIVGLVDESLSTGEREFIVRAMLERLSHRGPDGRGVHSGDGFTLGHTRLSIIDLTDAAAQPMTSTNGEHTIIFNGEVYNYLELRQKMIRAGHKFRSFSDTEVLLNVMADRGPDGLSELNGMFAFCVWSEKTGEWILARDHFGIKPLYYARTSAGFVFASEIKALFCHPEVNAKVNSSGLQQYLAFQFCLGEETLFDGIYKLAPGHYLTGKGSRIEQGGRFWETSYEIDTEHSEEYFRDHLLQLLEDSARLQIRADVPVGAYLSGGMDSSVVSTMAAGVLGEQMPVFCGKFNESAAYDESRYAKEVAEDIGARYVECVPTAQDFVDSLPHLIWMLDEPVAGPGLFPQYMVSRVAAKEVRVILGGQGGDEIFGGYVRYILGYLEQALKGAIFETAEEGQHVVTFTSILPNLPLIRSYVPMLKQFWAEGLFDDMDSRYFRLVNRMPDAQRLLSKDALEQFDGEQVFEDFRTIFNAPDTNSYFNKMAYFDQKTLLPALLQVEDRVSMAVSLESRLPLLDHRIAELVARMPPTMKFGGGQTKHILRRAVENVLPKSVLNRKDKMGFPVPLKEWLAGGCVRDFVGDVLGSRACKERGLFDPQNLDLLMDPNVSFGRQLWGALSLELWHQTFIDAKLD